MEQNKETIAEQKYIKHIHIEEIWGKHNVDFDLNEDVNILTGVNGVGKTTILDIIYSIVSDRYRVSNVESIYKSAVIDLNDNLQYKVSTEETGEKIYELFLNGKQIDNITQRIVVVSDIDSNILSPEELQRQQTIDPALRSELDIKLHEWLNRYYKYQTGISNKVQEMIQNQDLEGARKLYEHRDNMKAICNKLFGPNKEWVDTEDNTVAFKLKDEQDKVIPVTDLSSGEKHMLILLLSTMVQDNKSNITFWDEPEMSLHIGWQRQLIRIMRSLNPNMQLLIATHSPEILYEGWEDRVINIQRIKT